MDLDLSILDQRLFKIYYFKPDTTLRFQRRLIRNPAVPVIAFLLLLELLKVSIPLSSKRMGFLLLFNPFFFFSLALLPITVVGDLGY